ncbi:MAG: ATP:cob(I)alamin adenosyltransferase [Halothiobacillus sp. 24-54-40]|jgi:cob(I)alamin adenosyltransferase|nr:MAG: ATP:cob(I)alamin adenosyltransferase [Halothiobacillus sp. 35-54-62]OYY53022.1 MAG: ATP:cob(I)alamin adenosyltransferase [Halothiobacillus sp. 28-55-5]OYZ87794.1 MAG: ATP:cob(I)alamin adenosyltransferase [Halothiobacillus sp. 24-54-40]OZA81263.1 MAG: ATP:cob(I)alamin adenosyltransferase [Halothiobacillus sp. 39-53-45]HQS02017.1 cob(I)yrinic acid a,c-diamide adenosyltransferase [Halothiobacillus sp.]
MTARHRLSRIVTRTGDTGHTGMADGSRLSKTDTRVTALGALDELNAHLGMLRAVLTEASFDHFLSDQQHALFDLGGFLAMASLAQAEQIPPLESLEAWIETHNAHLPPLKEFILPGGSLELAQSHLARVTARRAERDLWALVADDPTAEPVAVYLNRLSDALFVLGRVIGQKDGSVVYWQRKTPAA